jgi:16S rRNA (uracil1498-N3)-methyltransferase
MTWWSVAPGRAVVFAWHNQTMRRPRENAGSLSRIHVAETLAPGANISLPAAAAHHLSRVLRATVGDCVTVFDRGVEYDATITHIDKHGVTVKLGAGVLVSRESPLPSTLVQAISSGDRMDYTLQKAVELGVQTIRPIYSERSVVRLDQRRTETRLAHWRQVAASACEQCGRNAVPAVLAPLAITDWFAELAAPAAGELRVLMSPRAEQRLAEFPRPAAVMLLAGPEGGFTGGEVELACERGFAAMRLGPRTLRTETAALAALAAMNTLWGDF